MNKEHKHIVNLVTGICRKCGLSANQKLTTECAGRQLRSDIIKLISNGEIDRVDGSWVNFKPKPTIKITHLNELPHEVHQVLHEMLNDLGLTQDESIQEDEPSLEELAHELAEVFGKAFKQPEIPKESPDFSHGELDLLQQIKDNPMPFSYVLSFALSKVVMDRLRTLIKYGAVMVLSDHYEVTVYGDSFLVKPEETEPELLSISEISFMFCCARKPWKITDLVQDAEAVIIYNILAAKGLVMSPKQYVTLTQAGHDHIAKLCAIPL